MPPPSGHDTFRDVVRAVLQEFEYVCVHDAMLGVAHVVTRPWHQFAAQIRNQPPGPGQCGCRVVADFLVANEQHDRRPYRPQFVVGAVALDARFSAAHLGQAVERPMPHMQAMNRVFRLLRDQANDPSQNRSSISLVTDLEWSTFSAKEAVPLRSTILPDAERRAMLDAYRRQFLKLLRQELDLEEALLNDDRKAVGSLLAAIEETENEGHERFR